jgi:hypothetical protein
MEDPHVVALYYQVKPEEGISYKNPVPFSVTEPAFDGELAGERFTVRMRQHFPTEKEARVQVDSYLRAWEVSAALRRGRAEVRFVFDHGDVIERAPAPLGVVRMFAQGGTAAVTMSGSLSAHITSHTYPHPPIAFKVSPLVETLWRRYERYISGREPLFAMAYFCLTAIEKAEGDRRAAATKFSIDSKVLSKMGDLSSNLGDELEARKMTRDAPRQATGSEKAWIETTIRKIIEHVGASEAGAAIKTLTLADLPTIWTRVI